MPGIEELISNKIEESNQPTTPEHVVNRLLELCMAATGRGYISDDYTETIEFPINDLWITSDSYYGRTWIGPEGDETEIEDEKTLIELSKELKKRLLTFDNKIKKTREKIAKEVFDKPLDYLFPKELTR